MQEDMTDKFRIILADIMSAAMFLSRLPLNDFVEMLDPDAELSDFGQTTRYFGLAALIVALPAALTIWLGGLLNLPFLITAVLAIIVHTLATGALHEDALCDVADGFGGGKTRKDKLRIMRDSQIGTYGASALVLSFLLQAFLLANLLETIGATGTALIIIAANMATTAMIVWPWATLPAARADEGGLSASHGIPSRQSAITAMALALPVVFALVWLSFSLVIVLAALAASGAAMMAFSMLCRSQIGGHTGDTLGATRKISELSLLLALIIAT